MRTASRWTIFSLVVFAMGAIFSSSHAAKPTRAFSAKPRDGYVAVDMFASMLAGDIDVKLIPKDATEATLVFKNKTKKPLAIRLPEAAAGVPVLAQIGFPGGFPPPGSPQGYGSPIAGRQPSTGSGPNQEWTALSRPRRRPLPLPTRPRRRRSPPRRRLEGPAEEVGGP